MTIKQKIGYLFIHLAVKQLHFFCWLFDWVLVLKVGVIETKDPPITLDKAMKGLLKRIDELSEERERLKPNAKA
jgi:hypothetical protein